MEEEKNTGAPDATGEQELDGMGLEALYALNEVVEEERERMRLWTPKLPEAEIPEGLEDVILRTFRRKVECMKHGEPYSMRILENGTYLSPKDMDFAPFFRECSKEETFKCKQIQPMSLMLTRYRKKLKAIEIRLMGMHEQLSKDESTLSKRIRVLVSDNVKKIRRVVEKTVQLNSRLSEVGNKAEDMWLFLKHAHRIERIDGALAE